MTDTEPGGPTTPTAPRKSILGNLARRLEEISGTMHLDVAVPKWTEPEIYVRYQPVDHEYLAKGRDKIQAAKKNQRGSVELQVNTDLILHAAVEVFGILDGNMDKRYSLREGDEDGAPTTFDEDLAEALGLDRISTGRSIVDKLFPTDGGIISHGAAIAEFSDYREAESDEAMRGES